jgi:hypothetical protein
MATARDAVIGDNNPPAPTLVEAAREQLADIHLEAGNWLDGAEIENAAQADEVARILDAARKASKRFDADRKTEKKPHDDAAKAVDATWKPLIADADRIVEAAKATSAVWLKEQDRVKREAEAEARRIADEAAAEARRLAEQNTGSLLAVEARDEAIERAKAAEAQAAAAVRDTASAKGEGMARRVSLRTTWRSDVEDRRALLNHIARVAPDDLSAFLDEWAARAVRGGARDLPGVRAWSEQVAA